eukprot:15476910-Alexandrium_andersonii.AAC.1
MPCGKSLAEKVLRHSIAEVVFAEVVFAEVGSGIAEEASEEVLRQALRKPQRCSAVPRDSSSWVGMASGKETYSDWNHSGAEPLAFPYSRPNAARDTQVLKSSFCTSNPWAAINTGPLNKQ